MKFDLLINQIQIEFLKTNDIIFAINAEVYCSKIKMPQTVGNIYLRPITFPAFFFCYYFYYYIYFLIFFESKNSES